MMMTDNPGDGKQLRWQSIPLVLLAVLEMGALTGCQPSGAPEGNRLADTGDSGAIVATAWPVRFLATSIAGDLAAVELVAPGRDAPGNWYPDTNQIDVLQNARLVLTQGAGLEPWLQNVTLRSSRVHDTTAAIRDQLIAADAAKVHRHGPDGTKSQRDVVSQSWLDPEVLLEQARVIRDQLLGQFPDRADELNRNFAGLNGRLGELRQLAAARDSGPAKPVVDLTGKFPYLLRATGITAVPFPYTESEILAGSLDQMNPGPTDAFRTDLFLVTPDTDPDLLSILKRLNLEALELDDLQFQPPTGDFVSVMQDNILRLQSAVTDE